MVSLIFSFDTEDFVTPESDDALLGLARILTQHGLRGSFALVGDKVRALLARGRRDVIDACREHDIQYHSNNHMFWPQTSLALSALNWDDGVDLVVRTERHGLELVEEVMGRRPVAWARPDGNQAVREMYGLRLLGLRAMAACSYTFPSGAPVWLVDQLLLPYNFAFERYLKPDVPAATLTADLLALAARIDDLDVPLVSFCHPTMLATDTFYDMHNVKVRGVVPPKAEWRPPQFVGPAELRRRLAVFAGLVEFVGSRRDMEVITISDYLARHEEGLCWLSAAEVTALAQAIRRDFSYQEHSGGYLSAADVAGVLSHGLTHWREHHRLPDQTPVRRIVGPPEPALALAEARSATANELATACQQIESEIEARWRLPSAIAVGQPAAAPVPPATYLMAMADAVLRLAAGEPDAAIELAPQPALPRCKDELLAKVQVGAYVLPQDFNLGAIPTYTHLQSWSLRPAVEVR